METTTLKHIAHMLEICDKQKTVTTARLKKELIRIENQAKHKINKQRYKHEKAMAELNKRAQAAETKVAQLEKGWYNR